VNNCLVSKSGVGALKVDDVLLADDHSKATALNETFAGVCTHDDGRRPAFESRVNKSAVLTDVHINVNTVYKQLCKLKAKNSAGPNGCHPFF